MQRLYILLKFIESFPYDFFPWFEGKKTLSILLCKTSCINIFGIQAGYLFFPLKMFLIATFLDIFESNIFLFVNIKYKHKICMKVENEGILIYTLLKKRNENNSTWVKNNSFPLIKRSFSSWVDFTRLNDLK